MASHAIGLFRVTMLLNGNTVVPTKNLEKNLSSSWDLNPQPFISRWKLQPLNICRLYGKQGWNVGETECHGFKSHLEVRIFLSEFYYSLIYPFLTYGVHVWGLTFPSFLTQLFIIQKKAIRIISFSEPKSHSEPLFKSLNLLKLNDVIELQILSFVYQWSHRLFPVPPCFNEYFKFTSSVHSYSTRQSCNRNLFVASVNTTQYGLRSLKFTGPRLWNSLPTSITNSNSLRIFRKTLKNSILNCYSI